MPSNKISYYFQPLKAVVNSDDDLAGLIKLHVDTFEYFGWEVICVDESVSKRHPLYDFFNDPDIILNKPYNEYHRACFMRWLAFAVIGCPHADFDVINYGFTPQDAADIKSSDKSGLPIMLGGAGAVGLLEGSDYDKLLDTYVQFNASPRIEGCVASDGVTDMTIMRLVNLHWYNSIPHEDDRVVKDFTHTGWETAKLVHYAHGLTDIPRVETIRKARPLPI